MSRRALLAGLPAAAALVVAVGCQHDGGVVDVKKFGATGDGSTDDSQAILSATAKLRSGGTLHFPSGTYRFAQRNPSGSAAIHITGVSGVTVEFDSGAELFMDNLDPAEHTGTSHGILISGPASRVSLRNVSIRWATGVTRSLGDGIRVVGCPGYEGPPPVGWPGSSTPVAGIVLSDCVIRASPQTGVVMLGVSDITVTGLQVTDSGGDGLHFNACRRAKIDGYQAVNTGDDGLALVTYFAPQFSFDDAAHSFSFPTLNDWSNADFTINSVDIVGGKANGVRIGGANRVSIDGLRAVGVRAGAAVMVDSAEPGANVGWNYLASRSIRVDDVTASNCDTGIHLLARPSGYGDQRFSDFQVDVGAARLDDCTNWSVRAESFAGREATGLRITTLDVSSTSIAGGNGGVGIDNARDMHLGTVSIVHTEPVLAFSAVNARQLAVDHLSVTITTSDRPVDPTTPCVSLEGSDGVIDDMDLEWSAAPPSWVALRRSDPQRCRDDSRGAAVTIRRLKLTPPVGDSAVICP